MGVRNKEEYAWYKNHGICVRCLKEKAEPGHTMCRMCRLNGNDYGRIWRDAHPKSEEKKRKDKEFKQAVYARNRELGMCFRCGKYPPIGTSKYSQCQKCNAKHARRKREREHEKGVIPYELRGDGLYCYRCCKPVCNGEKLCPECHEKAEVSARKAAEASRVSPNRKRIIYGHNGNGADSLQRTR